MSDLTPIRVRGKRRGTPAEKWNAGKQRKLGRQHPSKSSGQESGTPPSSALTIAATRRRKRHGVELSRIECLPTEILQAIFVYSGNISLPLVSLGIKSQLTSQHLYSSLTTVIMQPLLSESSEPTSAELSAARRLLDSKFMTWAFWQRWLTEQFATALPRDFGDDRGWTYHTWTQDDGLPDAEKDDAVYYPLLLSHHIPHRPVLPPRKLLSGPWTEDKIDFLRTLVRFTDITIESPVDAEIAIEGLNQAIAAGIPRLVHILLFLRLKPNTELLREAVINHGCNESVVRLLVNCPDSEVDLLDPSIWAWAEKARKSGNERGDWLIQYLRECRRISNHASDDLQARELAAEAL